MDKTIAWVTRHRVVIGVCLLVGGVGASMWLAFAASSDSPPDGAQSALLVIIGAILNLGGAWAISRRPGGPNLIGSRLVVRHLANITTEVSGIAALADAAFDRRPPGKGREDVGQLSWKLSDVESRLVSNLKDWIEVYPDLLEGEAGEKLTNKPEEK
jgi:hypothetical protein